VNDGATVPTSSLPTGHDGADVTTRPPRPAGRVRAILALLLIVAVAVLWHRSYRDADIAGLFANRGSEAAAMSLRGCVVFVATTLPFDERPWVVRTMSVTADEGARVYERLIDTPELNEKWGFVLARHPKDAFGFPGRWCVMVAVPHWALLPLGLPLLAGWVVRIERLRRRRRNGWCLACGYDLRGTVGGRCPECGTNAVAKGAAG
jgi:hypothetical protein